MDLRHAVSPEVEPAMIFESQLSSPLIPAKIQEPRAAGVDIYIWYIACIVPVATQKIQVRQRSRPHGFIPILQILLNISFSPVEIQLSYPHALDRSTGCLVKSRPVNRLGYRPVIILIIPIIKVPHAQITPVRGILPVELVLALQVR